MNQNSTPNLDIIFEDQTDNNLIQKEENCITTVESNDQSKAPNIDPIPETLTEDQTNSNVQTCIDDSEEDSSISIKHSKIQNPESFAQNQTPNSRYKKVYID